MQMQLERAYQTHYYCIQINERPRSTLLGYRPAHAIPSPLDLQAAEPHSSTFLKSTSLALHLAELPQAHSQNPPFKSYATFRLSSFPSARNNTLLRADDESPSPSPASALSIVLSKSRIVRPNFGQAEPSTSLASRRTLLHPPHLCETSLWNSHRCGFAESYTIKYFLRFQDSPPQCREKHPIHEKALSGLTMADRDFTAAPE